MRAPGYREPTFQTDGGRAGAKREAGFPPSPRAVRARHQQEQLQQQQHLHHLYWQQQEQQAVAAQRCYFNMQRPGGRRQLGGQGPIPSEISMGPERDPRASYVPLPGQPFPVSHPHAPDLGYGQQAYAAMGSAWNPVQQTLLPEQLHHQRPVPQDLETAHAFPERLSDVSHHFSENGRLSTSDPDCLPSGWLQTPALSPWPLGPQEAFQGDWPHQEQPQLRRSKREVQLQPAIMQPEARSRGTSSKHEFPEGDVNSARIPTPARSRRGVRHQGDEDAVQTEMPSRHRLQSIIRQTGRPSMAPAAMAEPAAAEVNRKLQFPEVPLPATAASVIQRDMSATDRKLAIANALNSAVKTVVMKLCEEWNFDPYGNDERFESDIGRWLCSIARRAERECANIMIQSLPAKKVAAEAPRAVPGIDVLQAREALLKAEVAKAKMRLESLSEHQQELERLEISTPSDFHNFLERVRIESSRALPVQVLPNDLDQFMKTLVLIEIWFQRTFVELQDAEEALEARDLELSAKAFGQLWADGPDAHRALSSLA